MQHVRNYVTENLPRFKNELKQLCDLPSVRDHPVGLKKAVEYIYTYLANLGANPQILEIPGAAPCLFGQIGHQGPTLLFYNHYDVQPVTQWDKWDSDPFDTVFKNGQIIARGASDDKGNLMARFQAIETYRQLYGGLPVTIKFFIDGEEENGGTHFPQYIQKYGHLLDANFCVWESGRKDETDRPAFFIGTKGFLPLELKATGARNEVHSAWGGLVPNAAWRLVTALSTMVDSTGQIIIDNLSQYVPPLSGADLALLEQIPCDLPALKERLGITKFLTDSQSNKNLILQRHFFEPSCTIQGLQSGSTESAKSSIPNAATARLDFRFGPTLTPELIFELINQHLANHGFDDISVTKLSDGYRPFRTPANAAFVERVRRSFKKVYGVEPVVHPVQAASGPMWDLVSAVQAPLVSFGIGYASDNVHGFNENIRLADYVEGILLVVELIHSFTEPNNDSR